jgi:hypothetical protein
MKRLAFVAGVIVLCAFLSGCSGDNVDGLILDTIQMLQSATENMRSVKAKVRDAVEKEKAGGKFELTEAVKAAGQLKTVSEDAVKIKQKIEKVRKQVSAEDRKVLANKYKDDISGAFRELLKQRDELSKQIADAKTAYHDKPAALEEISNLQKKLREAEGPFEAMARQ